METSLCIANGGDAGAQAWQRFLRDCDAGADFIVRMRRSSILRITQAADRLVRIV